MPPTLLAMCRNQRFNPPNRANWRPNPSMCTKCTVAKSSPKSDSKAPQASYPEPHGVSEAPNSNHFRCKNPLALPKPGVPTSAESFQQHTTRRRRNQPPRSPNRGAEPRRVPRQDLLERGFLLLDAVLLAMRWR